MPDIPKNNGILDVLKPNFLQPFHSQLFVFFVFFYKKNVQFLAFINKSFIFVDDQTFLFYF